MADARGIGQDAIHKKSIVTQIKDHIDSLTAVLVLADGTVPRVTVGTDHALSTLSSIFPPTLVNNIAFMFTNVSSRLHWNFSEENLPENLGHAPHFLLNNPIALQKRYFKHMNDQNVKKRRTDFHRAAKAAEPEALGAPVSLFDWLDGLEPQSTKEITSLYEISQAIDTEITNILAQTDQAATKKAEIDKQTRKYRECSAVSSPRCHPALDAYACWTQDVSNFVDNSVWKPQHATGLNYLCLEPNCYSTCSSFLLFTPFRRLFRSRCRKCGHPHRSHSHTRHQWVKEVVDEDRRKMWEAAKIEKENTEALIASGETVLGDLSRTKDQAMEHLARLAEDYIGRSLSGRLSAHVETTIWFLEERCTDMAKKGASEAQLGKMQDSLSLMRRKLVLLRDAEEKAQRGM